MLLSNIKPYLIPIRNLLAWFAFSSFVLSVILVTIYKYLPVYSTPLMAIRYLQSTFNTQANSPSEYKKQHQWQDLPLISKNLQLAVISSEDQQFFSHYGFDFSAIKAAITHNNQGASLRGASTISQQTAKNVFLWPQRSWLRKGLETWFTILIELIWDKQRILEVYLNSIEMGSGVYGANAAAKYWFNQEAKHLTKQQSSAIAAILPNPRKYQANPASAYVKKRQRWILQQMRNSALIP
jgi:monofunctional biosynthetic peptidoglycan transglycosylase